jgi:uncharacterized protein YybS (DUF2232 family)
LLKENKLSASESEKDPLIDNVNWVDGDGLEVLPNLEDRAQQLESSKLKNKQDRVRDVRKTLVMVETAFLASASSLIWLINYYFPLGPLLQIFFPIPIALVYLRWGNRAAWMTALVSGLLLSVLMGPTRSVVFLMPYGIMGVQLGALWKRNANWVFSVFIGALIGVFGFFFRFWLFSILLGEDLWLYLLTQISGLAEWIFIKLGILAQPNAVLIEAIALGIICLQNLIYLFVVHLVALLLFDRLGNPIPRPPEWVRVLLDYE